MKLKAWIKRCGLTGRAVQKARRLGGKKGIAYCKEYRNAHKTLPQRVREDIKDHEKYVDQVVVHKGFPSEALSAKDIYFMAFPSRAVEYLHCTKKRRVAIGVLAQHWTNSRISPKAASCRCHITVATSRHRTFGNRPRLLEFVPFGGTFTKTGHAKIFSWDSVKKQFAAEGIQIR